MPFTDVSADQVTAGAFTDTYTISGSFTVGNTAGAHVVIGADIHGADGVRLYGPDGVTPVIDLNIGGGMVAGSTVVGPVASSTTATTATTATNLGGGGTAAGSTAITGSLTVGNPAAAHVVVGTDVHGADGVRLYDADGVTALIDLSIASTPTIRGALIETAATGPRVILGDPNPTFLGTQQWWDDGTETDPATAYAHKGFVSYDGGVTTHETTSLILTSGDYAPTTVAHSQLSLTSASKTGPGNDAVATLIAGTGAQLNVFGDFTWSLDPVRYDGSHVNVADPIQVTSRPVATGLAFPANAGNTPAITGPASQMIGLIETATHIIVGSVAGEIAIRTAGAGIRFSGDSGAHTSAILNQFGGLALGLSGAVTPNANALYMCSGAPPNSNGQNGDFALRVDTPGTANQRLYVKSAGVWVGIV